MTRAATLVADAHDEVDVSAVARVLGVSERQLERRFLARIGVTPKRFATLRRFERAIARATTAPSLTAAALDAGYYDQSHFIRDFRRFAGSSPREHFARSRYKRDNDVATPATRIGPGPITGLTRVGHEVARQILAAGALVDVSDASELSIDEVIELARAWHAPVIATHSNARALADTPWNLADAQIREIAASNGIIGVTAVHGMLAPGRTSSICTLLSRSSTWSEWRAPTMSRWELVSNLA